MCEPPPNQQRRHHPDRHRNADANLRQRLVAIRLARLPVQQKTKHFVAIPIAEQIHRQQNQIGIRIAEFRMHLDILMRIARQKLLNVLLLPALELLLTQHQRRSRSML